MKFWDHRSVFPDGKRPFEDLEPVVETLRKLDPSSINPFYRPSRPNKSSMKIGEVETDKWLSIAEGLDYTARIVMEFVLERAMVNASEEVKEWLDVGEQAELSPEIDIHFVRKLATDLDWQRRTRKRQLEGLQDRIDRLSAFADFAAIVETNLNMEIDQLKNSMPNENQKN